MSQLQERPPQHESDQSLWRRYRRSKKARRATLFVLYVLPIVVLLTLMYTVFIRPPFNPNEGKSVPKPITKQHEPTAQPTAIPGARIKDLDTIVTQVLNDMNAHSWDDQLDTTLINWRKSDVNQVNCSPDHCDQRGHSTRRDNLNDLRILDNMYWYKVRHPSDTSMDTYIARILPSAQREWGNTVQNKGWIYFTLLHMRDFSHNTDYWNHTLIGWATSEYRRIDTQLGVQHGGLDTTAGGGNVHLQDGYRVDHALETSLALVDAGARFNHPEWVAAGTRGAEVVIQQSYNRQYHLFGRIYLLSDPRYGTNKLLDTQARMGETGQELEALLRTGAYTHNQTYLGLAKEMLDALETSPLRDKTNGGFYFKLYLGPYQGYNTGYVDKSIKEVRQMHVLISVHLANLLFNNRWADMEQDLIQVATQRLFLPAPVPGFSYRVLPNGDMYPCKPCAVALKWKIGLHPRLITLPLKRCRVSFRSANGSFQTNSFLLHGTVYIE
ncbi:hypothetical protein [Dictyobacter kobayashii]|uniref:Uncharacterized protein n=1 Tax=Dictyobacter kobayashii TaxID=2014872 RepID=A0A402AUG8_9CHLR|nr:hypothetical protein [Dictyobacter kobayashii]GCE22786.1 hypothetical protein KDK_65860 [Dictyobacter kobayashii]